MLANTPSVENPEPTTLADLDDGDSVCGVEYVGACDDEWAADAVVSLGIEFWRTSRCLSSASSSLASSSSKASASVESTWVFRWGDDAREWNDGGGDPGMG